MASCDCTHTCVLQILGHRLLCGCVDRCTCVAEFCPGSFHMIAQTHVYYRRQEFVVAVSVAGLAYVSVFEHASTCAAEASNHPLSQFM